MRENKRMKWVSFRVSPQELEHLNALAATWKLKRSAFVRLALTYIPIGKEGMHHAPGKTTNAHET